MRSRDLHEASPRRRGAIDTKNTHKNRVGRPRKDLVELATETVRTPPRQLDDELDDARSHTINERGYWNAIEQLAIDDELAPEHELTFGGDAW